MLLKGKTQGDWKAGYIWQGWDFPHTGYIPFLFLIVTDWQFLCPSITLSSICWEMFFQGVYKQLVSNAHTCRADDSSSTFTVGSLFILQTTREHLCWQKHLHRLMNSLNHLRSDSAHLCWRGSELHCLPKVMKLASSMATTGSKAHSLSMMLLLNSA